nr:retrovirus-related Pol polyprotein from transposon TNT 1-94 [Tanacetum cinerariifolium]
KARLVAQGHTQEEGIDCEDVFAPVARIEAIRLFLAYASFMGFLVYQMDVKSAFLYGTLWTTKYTSVIDIWRNQKSVHGLALVKRWKLLTSCGVHVITLSTVQLFLLVERRYPLSRFTLEQLLLELMLSKRSKKNIKCVNAVSEELTAAKHKLMLLVYCC